MSAFLLFSTNFAFKESVTVGFFFFVVTPYFLGSLATNKFRFWFVCYRVCRCKWLLGSIGFLPYGCFLMVAYLQILIILTFVLVFFSFCKTNKKSNITFFYARFHCPFVCGLSRMLFNNCWYRRFCGIFFCYCCYCVKKYLWLAWLVSSYLLTYLFRILFLPTIK